MEDLPICLLKGRCAHKRENMPMKRKMTIKRKIWLCKGMSKAIPPALADVVPSVEPPPQTSTVQASEEMVAFWQRP